MTQPSFALHQLGWSDFQDLCHTVTREILGQTVVAYLDNQDGGRDGAFTGTWHPTALETYSGEFVVQAKHTSVPDSTLGPADFAEEFAKAELLAVAGRCDVYLLMTNARLTARTEEKLADDLRSRGITQFRILGSTWINQTIRESSRLRMLVPRLYGLGDLTQILDERAYEQARALLDSMRIDLSTLVRTTTYQKAAEALDKFGIVVLAGAPATGKTTVAAELALASIDEYKTQVVTLDNPAQFPEHWNTNEKQLFWLDDAFGATQFDEQMARSWQQITSKVKAAIDHGSKFVLTTRDYILKSAAPRLKLASFPLFKEARVFVNVADLTRDERHQILYNHLKHGKQPGTMIERMLPYLQDAADHRGFTPELARRLADPAFTKNLAYPSASEIARFFAAPRQFLTDTLDGLDNESLAALGLIFVSKNWLPSPITLGGSQKELLERLGSSLGGVTSALGYLDGSLVVNAITDSKRGWRFAHPTMIDAYTERARNPELLHLLIDGFEIDALLAQTTCGDTGLANTIVLPETLWPTILERLEDPTVGMFDKSSKSRRPRSYLAHRCVAAFQSAFLTRHPHFLELLAEPRLRLVDAVDNDLVAAFHANGILPDDIREKFVGHLIGYCIDGTDGAVLWSPPLRAMLNPTEIELLRQRLLAEVVPDPVSILHGYVDGYYDIDDPEWLSDPVDEYADALETEFPGDTTVAAAADEMRIARQDWIDQHRQHEKYDDPDDEYWQVPARSVPEAPSRRSIFDDLIRPSDWTRKPFPQSVKDDTD